MVKAEANDIIKLYTEKNKDCSHPVLYAKKEDFDRIRNEIRRGKPMSDWYLPYKRTADYCLALEPLEWELRDNLRLLHVSQDATSRLYALAFAYQIERDAKYAERAWVELEQISRYPHWNPSHYLDLAQMTYAAAVAYDWIYEYLDENRRAVVEDMLVRHSLEPYKVVYENFASGRKLVSGKDLGTWSKTPGNWNFWCNGAAIAVAIAMGSKEPERCGFIIEQALRSLEFALGAYAPDGGFVEGVSYGMAANAFWAQLSSALFTALGTDYGCLDAPGMADFAFFVLYMTGTVTGFNFHDAGGNNKHFYSNGFFVANRKNTPALGAMREKALLSGDAQANLFDMIWYRPGSYEEKGDKLPLDRYFRKVETGSMRSSWDNDEAIWLAFHGGENDVAHTHLDSGTFVMDAMGLNWAMDLGTEPLSYFGTREQMGNHFLLYRMAPDGHNTLVINPSESEEGQAIPSFCPVTQFVSASDGAFAVMDLTAAYSRQKEGDVWDLHSRMVGEPRAYYTTKVHSAQRGYALLDNRSRVVIQDELKLVKPSEVWWSMHTPAKIEISDDGKTAILSQQGKRMRAALTVSGSDDYRLLAMKAEPLPNGPKNSYQTENTGSSKLAVCAHAEDSISIRMEFICIRSDEEITQDSGEILPLNKWSEQNLFLGGKL